MFLLLLETIDSDLFILTKFKHFTDKYKKVGRQRKDRKVISVSCHPPYLK